MKHHLKIFLVSVLVGFSTLTLLTGCVSAAGRTVTEINTPTVGQQLIDLQRAKEAGAISETEYETQKARFLNQK